MPADIILKSNGAEQQVPIDAIDLDAPSIVRLDIPRTAVEGMQRQGDDLIVQLKDGDTIRIADFFNTPGELANDLVFEEQDGTQWLAATEGGTPRYTLLNDLDELMTATSAASGGSSLLVPGIIGGVAGIGGIAAAASGGGNDDNTGAGTDGDAGDGGTVGGADGDDDTVAPAAPTGTINGDGSSISGTGEPGAVIRVTDPDGTVIGTATVAADGTYTVSLNPPQVDGETLAVSQSDAAGNVSDALALAAPDLTAPDAPDATVVANGSAVTGTGEPGATVEIRDGNGTVIGTAVVAADGSFTVPLDPPLTNGETLSVVQSDAAGNVSAAVTAVAPDTTAPDAPEASIAPDGSAVTGTGEPGATVTVTDADGNPIGSATVGSDGTYTLTLSPPVANGETIGIVQTDSAGNSSPAVNLAAPDVTAPEAPDATVATDGSAVTGTGEPGATVEIRDSNGTVIGTAVVAADGSFTVPLDPPLTNGETLSVVQSDAAGNVSAASSAVAPDTTAPDAPEASVAPDGSAVTGTGEPGATVTVTDADGNPLGSATVGGDGTYTLTLSPPVANGETIGVVQTDSAGNSSPAVNLVAPDVTAPATPDAIISADGGEISGTGEPGARITIRGPDGAAIGTAIVGGDGTYSADLTPAQRNGEALQVTQTDSAGNSSAAIDVTAPDLTAPDAPIATVGDDGTVVTGTGEPGATITVTDPDGTAIGSAIVGADGAFSVALSPAQIASETLGITQSDAAGNVSPPASAIAPDLTAPDAPTATVSNDGTVVTGTGEAGATITISDPAGVPIGTAIVGSDGSYSATLRTAQTNGEALSVVQSDAAGNVSPSTLASAPDLVTPPAPDASVSPDGALISGSGEPGATITVRDSGGTVLATGAAGPEGEFSIALSPPQITGISLSVTQSDGAGNISPATSAPTPDLTAPDAPAATINASGDTITGTGEAGATVRVTDADGKVIGTAMIDPDGNYSVALVPAETDGEALGVTQRDAAGNASAPTSLTAPDLSAPDAPAASVTADGSAVTGTGEPGTEVRVTGSGGTLLGTGQVNGDGSYSVTLSPAQSDGETVRVTLTDAGGNVSPATSALAPDLTAPDAPTAIIAADGSQVTGTGDPGASITVTDPDGTVLGTAIVGSDGSYTADLTPDQRNGELLQVTQADDAGNDSPAIAVTAPDLTAPDIPTASVSGDGSSVTGSGEAGATVRIFDADGNQIGAAQVGADGNYTAPLTPAQVDGETLGITQSDAAGNISPQASAEAPDLTAPDAPTAVIDATGTMVTGTGEAGATITVRGPDNSIIGTATVDAAGDYAAMLTPAQVDSETVTVSQTDIAGNLSDTIALTAPDLTAPDAPDAAVSGDGAAIIGTGEPGTDVTITDPLGRTVGTGTVGIDGNYAVSITPVQTNGETLRVTLTDAAGNVSPATAAAAPDLVLNDTPDAPTAAVGPNGETVTGTGEVGASVTVTDPDGVMIGSGLVGSDGNYAITLDTPQRDGEVLSVAQARPGGPNSAPAVAIAPDLTAPDAPVATLDATGTIVTGTGEPGATVEIRTAGGTLIGTGTVEENGNYALALSTAQTNGETLSIVQIDAAGNVSPQAVLTAPDLTAPDAPGLAVGPDGTTVTGTGEAGATVTVRDTDGTVIGTALVGGDGTYSAALADAQTNGETLTATQTDDAGNVSPQTSATAPDLTAPAAPDASVSPDGTLIAGSGEAGAAITVRDSGGTIIATGTVGPDGQYSIPLSPPQVSGDPVSVTQTDGGGNVSPATAALTPDLTAPDAPVATIDAAGDTITGTGEPGATVRVTDANGVPIGTATIGGDGTYSVTLSPAQQDGEALSITQRDNAGNLSAATPVTAPDSTAPQPPTATITGDGDSVSGTGEPGARITITDPQGNPIGSSIVLEDGTYSATLTPPQIDGETLAVTQADGAGNVSGARAVLAPDLTAPDAPEATIAADGTAVTGTGEPGTEVRITDNDGNLLGTGMVGGDGSYSVPLSPVQDNGGTVSVTLIDAGGNVSPAVTVAAPDLVAPDAPAATVSTDGSEVTGTGEPGAMIRITDPDGMIIGMATVGADGRYTAELTTAQTDGEVLQVVQTDAGGNMSPAVNSAAPDLTAPDAPVATISGDGTLVTGTGEAGAMVRVLDGDGNVIGSAMVGSDGNFSAPLSVAQTDGELLNVRQSDAAGNVSGTTALTAPDLTAPPAPVATVAPDGTTVTGTGEAGATVTVTDADGNTLGSALVDSNGTYTVPLTPAQANGEMLSVVQSDPAGNVSPDTVAVAPDITAPAAPTAAIDGNGAVVSGTGEPGATIRVFDPDDRLIGSGQVDANGTYSVTLTLAQRNGEQLDVVQADASDNVSGAADVIAPDLTAPAAPTGTVAADGASVTGTGEAGATVTVSAADGTVLGTAQVGADGSYTAQISPPQVDGEALDLFQTDAAGNVSPDRNVTAPDYTGPPAPTAVVAGDGNSVSGTGEAGATISVTDPEGVALGSTTVAANGTYTVALSEAQLDGERLTVSQTDTGGNASPPVTAIAPDLTAPDAPIATVGANGLTVTGTGEAGATVTVRDPDGNPIGTALVQPNGSYTVSLSSAQANGELLTVTQADPAGNVSPVTNAPAPDITAPDAADNLAVADDGTTLTGTGEAGASVEVTDALGEVIGVGTVGTDGSFAVTLIPPQTAGETLNVLLTDPAGNESGVAMVSAPYDITAFDNVATAGIDLTPETSNVTVGSANYLALVSLGVVNLQAEVLSVPNVRFTVEPGHTLDASFTYDALANIGVAAGYSVVVQQWNGTQWVGLDGQGSSSLLELGLLNGDLVAGAQLNAGTYRAFLTFDGAAGVGLLGDLDVAGVDADYTAIGGADPQATSGNVITDPGPGGELDFVSPDTVVQSVTVNGTVVAVNADGTIVDGQYGTLIINLDGSYSYTPDADPNAIGRTDSFTYTLIDRADGETESATLAVTIGSDDVTAMPVATDDMAMVTANYDNVVETVAPMTEFTFNTPGTLIGSVTRSGNDGFTVAADTVSDVTITAIRGGILSLLPSYTITVREADGDVVRSVTQTAVAGLPLGSGVSVTIEDLGPGNYTYTVSSTNNVGTGYGTTVYLGETVTHLDQYDFTGATSADGNVLGNDAPGTDFVTLRIDTGTGFEDVGDAGRTITGQYGTLTIDDAGTYHYEVTPGLAHSSTDLVDSFTYQIVQPGGTSVTASLDITIDSDTPQSGAVAMTTESLNFDQLQYDNGMAEVSLADLFGQSNEGDALLSHYLDSLDVDSVTTGAAVTQSSDSDLSATSDMSADPLDYLDTMTVNDDQHLVSHHQF
ncbi:BapA/Bap/LapF family large adhesin [Stakelama pacifica]|uniref:VCBS repeat-containing protein n=1 Tax=Stakelama pacifica TaxID=517720 RepID=A0A4R6FYG0_9SPHN|nr:BapA/Bap/LapF family large adhesin [Stakelama pacifica]TDN87012.1 VCBS repeat-containing protein [Stakelama pacifica]GGO91340.1 hypothetical protein GCM10011329_05850 [Stakelama pacifica]